MSSARLFVLSEAKQLATALLHAYDPQHRTFIFSASSLGYGPTGGVFRTAIDYAAECAVRPLLVLLPVWCATKDLALQQVILDTVQSCVDPESIGYLDPALSGGQVFVEAAYLTLVALELGTPVLSSRSGLVSSLGTYLSRLCDFAPLDNNWHWFKAFINLGAAVFCCCAAAHVANISAALSRIEDFYLGDGWYSDGPRVLDLYSAWSMQWWPYFYRRHAPMPLPRVEDTLDSFLTSYRNFFSQSGECFRWGRSQVYRFAAAAPLALMSSNPGADREILVSHLRYFSRLPIFNLNGLLTLGYASTGDCLVDPYSCAASPLWAAKAYWCLLHAESHPYWSSAFVPPSRPPKQLIVNKGYLLNSTFGSQLVLDQSVRFGGASVDDARYLGPFTHEDYKRTH